MEKARHKETIIVIAAGLLVLHFIFGMGWLLLAGLGILIIGIISDSLSAYIHKGWFWIADKLGFVTSRIILGLIFTIILVPVSFIAGLFRKDIMMLRRREKTYYVDRDHVFKAEDLQDPW